MLIGHLNIFLLRNKNAKYQNPTLHTISYKSKTCKSNEVTILTPESPIFVLLALPLTHIHHLRLLNCSNIQNSCFFGVELATEFNSHTSTGKIAIQDSYTYMPG